MRLTALQRITLLHVAACCDDAAAVQMLICAGTRVSEASSWVSISQADSVLNLCPMQLKEVVRASGISAFALLVMPRSSCIFYTRAAAPLPDVVHVLVSGMSCQFVSPLCMICCPGLLQLLSAY